MEVRTRRVSVILGVGLLALSGAVATAQQPSITKTTQMGQAETTTSTRTVNATVVSVDGNKVVGRDAAGKHTEYTIPDGFKFQYQGREIGVSELKPGMQVSAKITTTTTMTPVYVSEIRTGKVLAVSGDHIIVKGPQGNRQFSNADAKKRNAKIYRDGVLVDLSDLRTGDNFTAVIVTDAEPKIVSDREAQAMVSGGAPPPAPARRSGSGSGSGRRSGSGTGSRSRGVAQDGEPGSGRRPDGHALDRGRSRTHAAPPQALIVSLHLCTAGPSGPAVS